MKKGENHGRPTLYRPEYDEQVTKLCRLGATDAEIADFFNVAESTLNNWKLREPSFVESIKQGKIVADMEVANSLYKKATGYQRESVKIFQFQGEPVIVPYVEDYQPDTTAIMAWLNNRRPRQFKNRQEIEVESIENLAPLAELLKKKGKDESDIND